jgi:hypothetical protein
VLVEMKERLIDEVDRAQAEVAALPGPADQLRDGVAQAHSRPSA